MCTTKRHWRLYLACPPAASNQRERPGKSRLQELRWQEQLSQAELAAVVGLARPTLAKIEERRHACRQDTAWRITAAFGLADALTLFAPKHRWSPALSSPPSSLPAEDSPGATPAPSPPVHPRSLLGLVGQAVASTSAVATTAAPAAPSQIGLFLLVLAVRPESSFLDICAWGYRHWPEVAGLLGATPGLVPRPPVRVWRMLRELRLPPLQVAVQQWRTACQLPPAQNGREAALPPLPVLDVLWGASQDLAQIVAAQRPHQDVNFAVALDILRRAPSTLGTRGVSK